MSWFDRWKRPAVTNATPGTVFQEDGQPGAVVRGAHERPGEVNVVFGPATIWLAVEGAKHWDKVFGDADGKCWREDGPGRFYVGRASGDAVDGVVRVCIGKE